MSAEVEVIRKPGEAKIDRTLLRSRAQSTIDALRDYAVRIGGSKNPSPTAASEWAVQLGVRIEAQETAVKDILSAVNTLYEANLTLTQRLSVMTRENLDRD